MQVIPLCTFMIKKQTSNTWFQSKLILLVNILCIAMIVWVSLQNRAFAMIFFSLLLASQCFFWWGRKLKDDKKWVWSYSIAGILFTIAWVIPLYIAYFCVVNYASIDFYLNTVWRSGVIDVVKISFFLKP